MSNTVAPDFPLGPNTWTANSVFYLLLAPAILLWIIYWKLSRRHLVELGEKLPGPPTLPIIGNVMSLLGSPHKTFANVMGMGKLYPGGVVRLWIGPKLTVFLYDPKDIELILSSHIYIDKSTEYSFFKPWLGNGLLISTGHKWRSHRRIIAPTFHLNVLKSFIDLFNENSRHVCNRLKDEVGKTFDCHDYMSEATVEILLETAMGVSKKTQESGYEYAMAVMKMCDILHLRIRKIWLRPNSIFNLTSHASRQEKLLGIIHGLTKRVITSKKEAFKNGMRGSLAETNIRTESSPNAKARSDNTTTVEGLSFGQSSGLKDDLDVEENDIGEKKRSAFLELLLESAENGASITEDEIREQVNTIMFEGHDTTAAASSFFLTLMGLHQNIQDKVIQELDEIFGDSDRPATFQDTLEMKYLERCLMETLRMYPPVPIIARELKEDLKLSSGNHIIPAGATIVVATYKLHRMENLYPNPEVFDPDNFLPERQAKRHYYAFVPFSAGPRSCVGRKYAMLKLKILLSTILRNYRVYSNIDEKAFKLQADIILKREEGFPVRVVPRKKLSA
uniref:Cytochrome n=1 Tax=Lutzomyia longipalpis TaxID=7200 RepID=A0A1B0CWB4_LUTLO